VSRNPRAGFSNTLADPLASLLLGSSAAKAQNLCTEYSALVTVTWRGYLIAHADSRRNTPEVLETVHQQTSHQKQCDAQSNHTCLSKF